MMRKDIILVYSIQKGFDIQLNIFSASMQSVHSEVLSDKENQKTINVESLKSGLYIYNIVQNKQVISSGKFNVIH
jgi:hypothetical protein